MKSFLSIAKAGVMCALSLGILGLYDARASLEVSASVQINARADFEAPLASRGAWVEVGSYGHCWRPAGIAVDWRPYCEGRWVWTDCGWYWESDEPWAWACYHYGQWVCDPAFGWVWIPDVEWAPAWVVWRTGGGYIGWAPCGPVGLVVAPSLFAFVEVGHFSDRVQPRAVVVNNTTIINKTTVINSVRHDTRTIDGVSRKVVVNEGPGVGVVQKATGKSLKATPIQQVARNAPIPPNVGHRQSPPATGDRVPAVHEQQENRRNGNVEPSRSQQEWRKTQSPSEVRESPKSPPTVEHKSPPAAEHQLPPGAEHKFPPAVEPHEKAPAPNPPQRHREAPSEERRGGNNPGHSGGEKGQGHDKP
jgi:hypothetical protein